MELLEHNCSWGSTSWLIFSGEVISTWWSSVKAPSSATIAYCKGFLSVFKFSWRNFAFNTFGGIFHNSNFSLGTYIGFSIWVEQKYFCERSEPKALWELWCKTYRLIHSVNILLFLAVRTQKIWILWFSCHNWPFFSEKMFISMKFYFVRILYFK